MTHWAATGRRDAMDLFLGGFSSTLFPSLLIGRFRARERDVKRAQDAITKAMKGFDGWGWGGGAACFRLTEYSKLRIDREMPSANVSARWEESPPAPRAANDEYSP